MNVYELKRKALGHHCPQFGGSSKSSSSSNTEDNRVTAGSIGVSGSGNVITDGGTVARALDTVDAVMGDGFVRLLESADRMFDQSQGLIGQTQKAVADAYGLAQANTSKTIDNRTLIVLALAVAGAIVAINWKR